MKFHLNSGHQDNEYIPDLDKRWMFNGQVSHFLNQWVLLNLMASKPYISFNDGKVIKMKLYLQDDTYGIGNQSKHQMHVIVEIMNLERKKITKIDFWDFLYNNLFT